MGEYVNNNWNFLSHPQFKSVGKELANGRECKLATTKTVTDLIIKVDQTKDLIIFINAKFAGEYKTISKDFILSFTLTIKVVNTFSRPFNRFSNRLFGSPTRAV